MNQDKPIDSEESPKARPQKRGRVFHKFGSGSVPRLLEQPFFLLAAWVVFPLLFTFVLGDEMLDIYRRGSTLTFAYLLIAAVLLIAGWDSIRSSFHFDYRALTKLQWGWALVGVAVALRFALLEFLPPEFPINIEEPQFGLGSMNVIINGELPVYYRFSTIMGSIGFAIADNTLDSLRLVFRLAGGVSIVLMALTLRRLSVGWHATLLAVFAMSSLSVLVAGSGLAYENFSALVFEMLLLYCFVGAVTSRANAFVWAGFAGMVGGVLLHEWVCYIIIAGLPPMFWFAQAVLAKDADSRRAALQSGVVYIGVMTLTGAPALWEMLNSPSNTILLDPLFRHGGERSSTSPDAIAYLTNSGSLVWNYTQALFGQNYEFASGHFRLADSNRVVPLVIGTVFAISSLYALSGKAGLFAWVMAVMLVVLLLGASFLANNFLFDRIISALPIVILLSGIAMDAALKRLQSKERLANSIRKNPLVYSTLLTGIIITVNVSGIIGMSSNESMLREYQNHSYVTCLTIAEGWDEFELEHVRLYGNGGCNKGDDIWLYPDMQAEIIHANDFGDDMGIESGTLMVASMSHGLEDDVISRFVAFSDKAGSSHTLRINENLLGDVAAMSFCYQCEERDRK